MDLFYYTQVDKFSARNRQDFLKECYHHPGRTDFRLDSLDCRHSFSRHTHREIGFDEALVKVGTFGHLIVVLRRPVGRLDETHGEILVRTSNRTDPNVEYFLYIYLTKSAFYEIVERWGLQQQPYLLDEKRPLDREL